MAELRKNQIAQKHPELYQRCSDRVFLGSLASYESGDLNTPYEAEKNLLALWKPALFSSEGKPLKVAKSLDLANFKDLRKMLVGLCQGLTGKFYLARSTVNGGVNDSGAIDIRRLDPLSTEPITDPAKLAASTTNGGQNKAYASARERESNLSPTVAGKIGLADGIFSKESPFSFINFFEGHYGKVSNPSEAVRRILTGTALSLGAQISDFRSPGGGQSTANFVFQNELLRKFYEGELSAIQELHRASQAMPARDLSYISSKDFRMTNKKQRLEFKTFVQSLKEGLPLMTEAETMAMKSPDEIKRKIEQEAMGLKKSIGFEQMRFLDDGLAKAIKIALRNVEATYDEMAGAIDHINVAVFDPESAVSKPPEKSAPGQKH